MTTTRGDVFVPPSRPRQTHCVSPFAYVPSRAPCVHFILCAFVCGCFISLSGCSITHDDQGTPYYIIIYILFSLPPSEFTPRPPPFRQSGMGGVSACVCVPSAASAAVDVQHWRAGACTRTRTHVRIRSKLLSAASRRDPLRPLFNTKYYNILLISHYYRVTYFPIIPNKKFTFKMHSFIT